MYESATTRSQESDILKNIFQRNRTGQWEVDVKKPFFEEANTRNDTDLNRHRHKGRSRLIVESEMPGGLVSTY